MTFKPVLTGFAGRKAICDAETYPNFILIKFEDVDTGEVHRFVIDETRNESHAAFAYFKSLSVVVTYNGHGFDDHILDKVFYGYDHQTIYEIANDIINSDSRSFSPFLHRDGSPKDSYPLSIDLAQILRHKIGDKDGQPVFGFPRLKQLGNRFGYKHLQALPIKPGTALDDEQKAKIDSYNQHDLNITRLVLEHLNEAIEMRVALGEQFNVSLTSRADATVGETIVKAAYTKAENDRIMAEWQQDGEPEYYRLERPRKNEWVCSGSDILSDRHCFTNPALTAVVEKIRGWTLHWKRSKDPTGAIKMDKPSFNLKVKLSGKVFSVGLGGLHSEDEQLIIEADDENALTDIDVSSYYPGLVVNERLAPDHLNADIFCAVVDGLMQRRLDAKAKKQKEIAQGMKIAINAMYGKLADRFSPFLDPPKGVAVTINGQLILLKLIEELDRVEGVRILSANTDGLLIHHPRKVLDQVYEAMKRVRAIYSLNKFDVVDVQRLCRATVNEYAMSYREDGKLKIKGRGKAFNDGTEVENLSKKTDNRIIKRAAIDCLLFDLPVAETVKGCRDLTMFLGYESLNAAWDFITDTDGNRLEQNTNRWYESTKGTLLYKEKADGKRSRFTKMKSAVVVNDIPDAFPDDVNSDYYIWEAQKIVDDIRNPKQRSDTRSKKSEKLSDAERNEWEDRQNETEANIEWLLALDLNYYRDLYTGLVAINNYNSMRAALKALWKSNLGMSRADLIWCFESFNTADGYFDRDQKRKSMLSYIDWITENIVPAQKEVFPEEDGAPVCVAVRVLDDEPGGGKTRCALLQIVHGGANVYWWAINKISPLARERYNELMAFAGAADVKIDFLPIHSELGGRGTMKVQIDKRMKEINEHPLKNEMIFVTIITHKTLIDQYLANVSGILLIDEPVQVWEQRHFDFTASHRTIRQLIEPMAVSEDYDSDLNAKIDADTQAVRFVLTDAGREQVHDEAMKRDTVFGSYRWILEQAHKSSGRVFALAEQWNQLDEPETGGGMDVVALLHPKHIAHFDECWMMAAHFRELVIYQLWEELYDVEWQFACIEGGWQRTVPLRDRVNLYYILEHRQVTDTYLNNRGDPRRRRAIAQAVREFYGDAPFIWSVGESQKETGDFACLPTDVEGVDGNCHPAYLTPKANGINAYRGVHGAAWLGTIKLPSTLLEIIGRLWGRQDAERMALIEYELYSCLQFLARGNSRCFDSTDQVRYVVADFVQAEYIARMWNLDPAKVMPLTMRQDLKDQLDDMANKGRGRKPTKTDEERREYLRQKSARRRATKAAADGRTTGKNGRPKKANLAVID